MDERLSYHLIHFRREELERNEPAYVSDPECFSGPLRWAGGPRCAPMTLVSLGSDGNLFEVSPKLNYTKTIISAGLARVRPG